MSPSAAMEKPQAIYTPAPVYRPEWAKQSLAGKGVVLVTVDKDTGKVTGARMEQSTGSNLLDGAALEAYSKWQFKPGTATQVRLPIEFRSRPPIAASPKKSAPPGISYLVLILIGVGVGVMLSRRRRAG